MIALGYLSYVDRMCEAQGPLHIKVGYDGVRPLVACGNQNINWTTIVNPRDREICKRCKSLTK